MPEQNSDEHKMKNIESQPVELPRIGVFICDCGSNIAGIIDVSSLVTFAAGLPNVIFVEEGKWICAVDYLTKIKEYIKEHQLNRVVVACCTPRTHEPTFKATVKEAGLNPFLLEFVSIREQSSWVHRNDPIMATETAKDLIQMGVAKARYLEPGEELKIPVGKECLVIGGGISGISAALALGDIGFKVYLVERSTELGGIVKRLNKIAPFDVSAQEFINSRISQVLSHDKIEVFTNTEITELSGYVGNFTVTLSESNNLINNSNESTGPNENSNIIEKNNIKKTKISTIIVATGMQEREPEGWFGFGKYTQVVTQLQLEEMLNNKDERLNKIKNVAIINCVNSRNPEHGCCNIGCLSAIKNIKNLKESIPDINAYLFFRDFNITGIDVEYHYSAMDKYSAAFRYPDGAPPLVQAVHSDSLDNTELQISSYDILTGNEILLKVDLVVLTPGFIGDPDNSRLKGLLKVSTNPDGFFSEAHVKLRPLDFANEGIYVCGCARWPKGVRDCMEEAIGAAMRAAIPMERTYIETEGIVADVDTKACVGCGICLEACAYGAPNLVNHELDIIKAICKGCGTCAASCPEEAIDIIHFSDEQLLSQIEAAMERQPENKILAFACHWCALGAVDNAGVSRFEYPANVRIIRVMCSGRVDPKFIIHAFKHGAKGVLVAGCEIPTCHYISGNFYAEKKIMMTKKLLQCGGIDQNRLRLEWLSAAQGARFAQVIKEFNAELDEIGELKNDHYPAINMKTLIECSNNERLRILGAKLKDFSEVGNRYGEEFTDHELERLISDIVNDEFVLNLVKISLKEGKLTLTEISKGLGLSKERIFKTISQMMRNDLIYLTGFNEDRPIFELILKTELNQKLIHGSIQDTIKKESTSNRAMMFDQNETIQKIDHFQKSYDSIIIGTTFEALRNALELTGSGKKVCLISENTSFVPEPWLLSEYNEDYNLYINEYSTLLTQIYENKNITVLRNTRIIYQSEPLDGKRIEMDILKKTTFIDESKCDNCGKCYEICPVNIIDHDSYGLRSQRAIYHPWPRINSVKAAISKGIPYCQVSCAIDMDVRGYIGKLADNDISGSLEIIRCSNPLPEVCGKVCDHFCESTCARGYYDEPLQIRRLKRFATEAGYEELQKKNLPIIKKPSVKKNTDPNNRVAIIGSGPAGLTAAHELAMLGYPVTIFESEAEPGGMLRLGIPGYRLPHYALENEINAIFKLGIELKLNTPINEDFNIDQLKEQGFKAIFIAIGTQKSLTLGIDGENLEGVYSGLEFLKRVNIDQHQKNMRIGKNIAVIGGGNVAVDCARTAKRLGANNVHILYRRTRDEMPAATEELEDCEAENIKISYLVAPKRILGKDCVKAIECQHTELGIMDNTGRRRPVLIDGSEFNLEVDTILVAIGQIPDLGILHHSYQFDLNPNGTFIVNPETGATNFDGIFAGGDLVSGPANVVGAINWGKKVASAIDHFLTQGNISSSDQFEKQVTGEKRIKELELLRLGKFQLSSLSSFDPKCKRVQVRSLANNQRTSGFTEVELPMTTVEAESEAKRCLSCRMCIGCGICQMVCPKDAVDYAMKDKYYNIVVDRIFEFPKINEGKFKDRFQLKEFYRNNLNVLTLMEFEYLLRPDSIYSGQPYRLSDGRAVKSIAFVHLPEHNFENDEGKEFNTLELEYIYRMINELLKNHKNIDIKLFTNLKEPSKLQKQFERIIGSPRCLENPEHLQKYIAFLDADNLSLSLKYEDEHENLELIVNGHSYIYDLVVIGTGLWQDRVDVKYK